MGKNESKAAPERDGTFSAKEGVIPGDQGDELSDGQLGSVAGGMVEIEMWWDSGADIQCPQCMSRKISVCEGRNNYVRYRCGDCKTEFMVHFTYGSTW